MTAVEHVGIEVDLARPLDRMRLRVDADLLEEVATVADRSEHPAGFEESPNVDVLYRAIGEGQSQPMTVKGLHSPDLDQVPCGSTDGALVGGASAAVAASGSAWTSSSSVTK